MIDHITIGVRDIARSCAFYDRALAPLGVRQLLRFRDRVEVAAYGDDRPWLWLAAEDVTRGKLHLAFIAPGRATVDAFHAAGLAAGGIDNGAPGLRPHYDPGYYAAFVLDPDGHNIEAVCRRPD